MRLTDEELLRIAASDQHPVVRELAARLEKRVDAARDVHEFLTKTLPDDRFNEMSDVLCRVLDAIKE